MEFVEFWTLLTKFNRRDPVLLDTEICSSTVCSTTYKVRTSYLYSFKAAGRQAGSIKKAHNVAFHLERNVRNASCVKKAICYWGCFI